MERAKPFPRTKSQSTAPGSTPHWCKRALVGARVRDRDKPPLRGFMGSANPSALRGLRVRVRRHHRLDGGRKETGGSLRSQGLLSRPLCSLDTKDSQTRSQSVTREAVVTCGQEDRDLLRHLLRGRLKTRRRPRQDSVVPRTRSDGRTKAVSLRPRNTDVVAFATDSDPLFGTDLAEHMAHKELVDVGRAEDSAQTQNSSAVLTQWSSQGYLPSEGGDIGDDGDMTSVSA